MENTQKQAMSKGQVFSLVMALLICVGLWWLADSPIFIQLSEFVTKHLDAMRETVLKLTAISTVSSTLLTLIPGDVATPLAENLADISDYLIIVFAGLWLQKYLFFSLSGLALRFLIPAGIILTFFPQVLTYFGVGPERIYSLRKMGTRIASFGTVLFLVVPMTLALTKQIEGSYQETIDRTVQQSEAVQASVDSKAKDQAKESKKEAKEKAKEEQPKDLLGQVSKVVTDGVDGVVNTTTGVINQASVAVGQVSDSVMDLPNKMMETLDNLIDSLAMMLVVNCIAPIFIFVFLMWLTKLLFGISLQSGPGNTAPIRPVGNFVRKYRKHGNKTIR